MEPAQKTTQNF